jgi:hypothetical protein
LLRELTPRLVPLELADLSVVTYATDPEALRLAVEDHVASVHARAQSLADELASLGLLPWTPDASRRLRVRVEVRDRRSRRDPPLTAPPSRPGVEIVLAR